jgi:hypothetical protein
MTARPFGWQDLDDLGLITADAAWGDFLSALRASGESFEVRGPVDDWLTFLRARDAGATYREWHVVGGSVSGRSYVLADTGTLAVADRVSMLASATGRLMAGYQYLDITADAMLTVARGDELLRYTLETNFGQHAEGELLPGEPDDGLVQFPTDAAAVLQQLGFDPDEWLRSGERLAVDWQSLDPEERPELHQRLYFGPLRMRVDHIQQAALAAMEGEDFEDE